MRRILFWPALAISIVIVLMAFKPFRYARLDPDYRWIIQQIDASREQLNSGRFDFIDWRQFPGEAWERLCVVGGYRNTAQVAHDNGIEMPDRDQWRYGVRVSEHEMAVLIVYPADRYRLILLPYGYPQVRQGEVYCLAWDDR